MSNQAAFLDGKGKQLRVGDTEKGSPGAGEILIQNKAIAINPVDWKVQDTGMFIQQWPIVLGCDVAGIVEEVGSGVSNVKKGDRVTAHTVSLVQQQPKYGGFQLYSTVPGAKACKIPDSTSFNEAVVLPLAFDTAAVGLFDSHSKGSMGLEKPTLTPTQSGKTVVVYGGSSSVGALAIQLATASGAHVIATASSHNFDFCKSLGAQSVFDYKSSSVVDDVVKAVNDSAPRNFVGIYDAISTQDSYKITVPILEKLGMGNLAVVLPGPEKVPHATKVQNVFGISELTHDMWTGYLPEALQQGKLKCVPPPQVIGKGLDSVQKGCDANKAGVSAKKVVIEL